MVLLIVSLGVAVLVARLLAARRRTRSATAASHTSNQRKAPNTFEELVAERLGHLNGPGAANDPSNRVEKAHQALTPELLRTLEWKRFELLTSLYFNATGIRAERTCVGPDGGIDVKLFRAGEQCAFSYIQCKAWGSEKIPITKVREFFGVMAADGIKEGVFFTTSDFWPDARAFAEANGITAMKTRDFLTRFNALPRASRSDILTEVTAGDYTTPTCPSCDSKMVWKASPKFWACPRYPRCRSKPIYARA